MYVLLCHDEALHYLRFSVLCAQGLSLHCRTLLKFMNVPTRVRREHTKVQESAPFASEPVLFVSGNTLRVNVYVMYLTHPQSSLLRKERSAPPTGDESGYVCRFPSHLAGVAGVERGRG